MGATVIMTVLEDFEPMVYEFNVFNDKGDIVYVDVRS